LARNEKNGRGKGAGPAGGVGLAGRDSRKGERKEEFPFSFSKQISKLLFKRGFESFLYLKQNHSSQKIKCSSMSASTCIYPYL
jgi:ribosomal protein L15